MSHTSTLLTSLQAQLSRLLASQGGTTAAAGAGRLWAQEASGAPCEEVPVAVAQARAAAEALAIAQQAQAHAAAAAAAVASGEGEPQPLRPVGQQQRRDDALADVQLPSFRRFAELRGLAGAVTKPPAAAAPTGGDAPALAPTWRSRTGATASPADSPPQPRALPQSLHRWSAAAQGAAAAAGGQENAAGFEWRPLSAAGSCWG